MAVALILSSLVAASRIGGGLQQTVLAADGFDPVLAPTIMLSRNPAKGGVGQATSPDVFRAMLGDIEADAVFGMVDVIITGYFASSEQVEIAAAMLERVRAGRGHRPLLIVDPVIGDEETGLYVPFDVAETIRLRLAPQADYLTPNLWELAWLLDARLADRQALRAASRRLGKPLLVTSVPAGPDEIGVACVADGEGSLIAHIRLETAPKGTGDLVTASFAAGLAKGLTPVEAAERAAKAAYEAVGAAFVENLEDLPAAMLGQRLVRPTASVRIEPL